MSRPTREHVNMQIAQIISTRGTCARLQVGAVITINNKIVSTGYNGPPKDQPHCTDGLCNTTIGCQRSTHAEENAIINAGKALQWTTKYKDEFRALYCTTQPCFKCAMKISAALIHSVYFKDEYRNSEGLLHLIDSGIKVYQIDEHGNTKQIQDN